MTIVWPVTLPEAPLLEGFQETAAATAIRTDMEQGPAKVRRRTTAGVGKLSMRYLLSKAEVVALETFYDATLGGGALSFSFTHPRTGASLSCRFTEPPQYVTTNGDHFLAALTLETLP